MASGYQAVKERREALASLGRTLSRRSGSKCELCGASGTRLTVEEVAPLPEKPSPDHAVFLCDRCAAGVRAEVRSDKIEPTEWRFLETAVWSQTPPAQVLAVRLCRKISRLGAQWATDALDNLYLSPEVESWADSG